MDVTANPTQAPTWSEADALRYVQAAAAALGIPMDDVRAQRVALQLARNAALAATLENAPLTEHDELAEIYQPLAFPHFSADGQTP